MLITAYTNRLRLAGYRPASVKAKESCLRAFAASVAPHQVTHVGRLEVEAYLSRPLAPESRRAYRGHLRGFYVWALEEGYVQSDPTAKLPAIRVPRASPRPIKDTDLVLAIEQADVRMRAWLMLMSLGGLRCIEVAALRPDDLTVNEDGAMLFLRECKGGGTAHLPAHTHIVSALRRLPVRDARWWDVSAHHVSTTVGAYLRGLGINASAHQLRHWAGTAWFRESGHDLLATAVLLRHASVATTQVYAQLDPTRPASVVSKVSLVGPETDDATRRQMTLARSRQVRAESKTLRRGA